MGEETRSKNRSDRGGDSKLERRWCVHGARARAWDSNYQELAAYVANNNLTLPDANSRLGKWYYGQRERYRMGSLTDERIDLLMSIAKKIGKSRQEFLG